MKVKEIVYGVLTKDFQTLNAFIYHDFCMHLFTKLRPKDIMRWTFLIFRYLAREIASDIIAEWLRANPETILGAALFCVILFTVHIICTDRRIDRQIIDKWVWEIVKYLLERFISSFIIELIYWIIGGGMW